MLEQSAGAKGPDRPSLRIGSYPGEAITPQLPFQNPDILTKPKAAGTVLEQLNPGSRIIGLDPLLRQSIYLPAWGTSSRELPTDPQQVDISGLKVTDQGEVKGLTGQEKLIVVEGRSAAVLAYNKNFTVDPENQIPKALGASIRQTTNGDAVLRVYVPFLSHEPTSPSPEEGVEITSQKIISGFTSRQEKEVTLKGPIDEVLESAKRRYVIDAEGVIVLPAFETVERTEQADRLAIAAA